MAVPSQGWTTCSGLPLHGHHATCFLPHRQQIGVPNQVSRQNCIPTQQFQQHCGPDARPSGLFRGARCRDGFACAAAKGSTGISKGSSGASPKTLQPDTEQPLVTGPLSMATLEQLTSVERQPAPRWDTFCGVSGGCWSGTCSAFSPTTGQPEAVALDEDRKPVFDLQTIVVDERLDDELVERRVQHAASADSLQLRGDSTPSQDEAEWDTEAISSEEPGLVVFDGGSYSRGPERLGVITPIEAQIGDSSPGPVSGGDGRGSGENGSSDGNGNGSGSSISGLRVAEAAAAGGTSNGNGSSPAESEPGVEAPADATGPEQRQVSVIEQCVAWGGESRTRIQITLSCGGIREGQELDVEILRVAVFRESWQCLTDNDACIVNDAIHDRSRLQPAPLAGDYKVFDLSAVPVEETDPLTGETRQQHLYFSQETAQRWGGPVADSNDGAALWLPGRLLLQLRMVPLVSRGREADASEGMAAEGLPRGLLLSAGWAASNDGLLSLVEREYDGSGALTEVRARTAVLGGWVGGRM